MKRPRPSSTSAATPTSRVSRSWPRWTTGPAAWPGWRASSQMPASTSTATSSSAGGAPGRPSRSSSTSPTSRVPSSSARPDREATAGSRAFLIGLGYAARLRARWALRSAPRSNTVSTPIHTYALTGPREVREGPQEHRPLSFDRLGLSPGLLRAGAQQGYTEPTPVQQQAIPLVLEGRDVLAGAQTGTGKTAAFVLPMVQRLHASRPAGPRVIRALILTPTRELALQVAESVRTYGSQNPIRSTTIYGGVGFDPQVRALRAGPEIVVATSGRLLDHVGQRTIDLSRVEILVLDEADRMLDMGFIRDIRKILAVLPARRQNLLFSATFSDEIRELASGLLHEPAYVQIARRNAPIELVRQVVHPVDRERKRELLSHLIRSGRIDQALVFTRTKHGASRLATQLEHDGITATA